jgi:hypothetical protein
MLIARNKLMFEVMADCVPPAEFTRYQSKFKPGMSLGQFLAAYELEALEDAEEIWERSDPKRKEALAVLLLDRINQQRALLTDLQPLVAYEVESLRRNRAPQQPKRGKA